MLLRSVKQRPHPRRYETGTTRWPRIDGPDPGRSFRTFSASAGPTRPKRPARASRARGICGSRGRVGPALAEHARKPFPGSVPSVRGHRGGLTDAGALRWHRTDGTDLGKNCSTRSASAGPTCPKRPARASRARGICESRGRVGPALAEHARKPFPGSVTSVRGHRGEGSIERKHDCSVCIER